MSHDCANWPMRHKVTPLSSPPHCGTGGAAQAPGAGERARFQVLSRIARDIDRKRRQIGTLKRAETGLTRLVEHCGGRLAPPVRGELANRFGSPPAGWRRVLKGLFFAAPAGEGVRAVAAGRWFSDWLRGFGNLLIIDYGESYLSLYG